MLFETFIYRGHGGILVIAQALTACEEFVPGLHWPFPNCTEIALKLQIYPDLVCGRKTSEIFKVSNICHQIKSTKSKKTEDMSKGWFHLFNLNPIQPKE